MKGMVQTAVEGFANLLATRVTDFNGNVKAFHAEREEDRHYPYAVVDANSWELQQEFNTTDIVDNAPNPDYIVHQDGLAIIQAQLRIGAQHKANLLDLTEQIVAAMMPSPGVDYTIQQLGVFFDIIEKTSGATASVRIETGSLNFEYEQVASDRWEAACTVTLSTPWVRVFQNSDNPTMELQCVVDWTFTEGG